MKRIVFLLGMACLLTFATNTYAQKKFTEGKIVYEIKISDDGNDMMAAMLPTEMTMKIKGTKSRTEMISSMSETIAISDSKDKYAGIVLLDIMGNKYAMKIDEKTIKDQEAKMPQFEVKETSETKEIAGYKCKKAILINKANKEEISIYYSEEFPYMENSMTSQFKDIKGMPMEFSTKMNQISMNIKVKSITKEKVDDAMFTVPSDYKMTTQEELMKEFGGGQ